MLRLWQDLHRARWNQQSVNSGQLALEYGFTDLDGSQPDVWRYIEEIREKHPDLPRPYRVFGYPWVPALFLVAMIGLVLNTLRERPVQSLLGLGIVALGVPFFRWQRRTSYPSPLAEPIVGSDRV